MSADRTASERGEEDVKDTGDGPYERVEIFDTTLEATELARTSRLVSRLTGYVVQPNKAVVGRNAFAHESGIHQDLSLIHI